MEIREYGIVEDDLPLRGPWSRREDASRPADSRPADYAEDREAAGGSESVEDLPLQGPWSTRREEDPDPREGYGELPPAERKRRPAAQEAGGGPRAASVEEAVRPAGEVEVPAPGVPGDPAAPEAQEAWAGCPSGRRRGVADLFTPMGVYRGFIMAEILGSRGGRSRRRPY